MLLDLMPKIFEIDGNKFVKDSNRANKTFKSLSKFLCYR